MNQDIENNSSSEEEKPRDLKIARFNAMLHQWSSQRIGRISRVGVCMHNGALEIEGGVCSTPL